jgi:hypothetical protein
MILFFALILGIISRKIERSEFMELAQVFNHSTNISFPLDIDSELNL